MNSINFDKGYKTYAINEDENNCIRINVADPNLKDKIELMLRELDEYKESKSDSAVTPDVRKELDVFVKQKLNDVFGQGFSEAVFGDMNVFAITESGKFIYETFMEAFLPIVQADIDKAVAANKKHIADLVDSKKLDTIAAEITETSK